MFSLVEKVLLLEVGDALASDLLGKDHMQKLEILAMLAFSFLFFFFNKKIYFFYTGCSHVNYNYSKLYQLQLGQMSYFTLNFSHLTDDITKN